MIKMLYLQSFQNIELISLDKSKITDRSSFSCKYYGQQNTSSLTKFVSEIDLWVLWSKSLRLSWKIFE